MKTKFLFCGILLMSMLFAFGCDPSTPPSPEPPDDITYTLFADKTEVNLNEEVTFTVTSSEGKDVTDKWQLCDDNVCFGAINKLKWSTPGTYQVKAQLGENPQQLTENKVTITVKGSVYKLTADKTTIYELETVKFKVTEIKDGVELDKEPINFQVGFKDGDRFKGMESIFSKAGVYTVDAWKLDYQTGKIGIYTDNSLEIIVKKREATGYEDNFYRRSLVSEYTGTWCNNCPELVRVIHYADDYLMSDRFITAAFHWFPEMSGVKDACDVEYTLPVRHMGEDFGLQTFPSYVIDWNKNYSSNHKPGDTEKLAKELVHSVEASQARYGDALTPGIAMETSLSGRNLSIKVKMTPREEAKYFLGVLFVEDNMDTYQNGGDRECTSPTITAEHPKGCKHMTQNNVVHKSITKGNTRYEVDSLGALTADKEYTYDYNLNDIAAKYNLANCRVIAYVCKADLGMLPSGYFVANAMTVKVGESVAYQYEPIYE